MANNLIPILNNVNAPSGDFGTTTIAEGVLGEIQFTNNSAFPITLKVSGSNDSSHFGPIKTLRARASQTIVKRLRLPQTIKFKNPDVAAGPVTLILKVDA